MQDYLTMPEVAAITRTPIDTLRWWRHRSTGPASFKVGRRVLYKREDVTAWLDAQYAAGVEAGGGPRAA